MKLSTALLKFAEPLWVPGSPPLSTEEFERALSLATLVWNVAVMEGVLGRRGRGRAELLRALMPGEQASEIEALLQRKKRLFSGDHRLITSTQVTLGDGEWHVQAQGGRSAAARGTRGRPKS